MAIKIIKCAPFVNESEKIALETLEKTLKNNKIEDEWLIYANVSLPSGLPDKLPVEIDLLIIGPSGVQVIEVKHWDRAYITRISDTQIVKNEADKINYKAKIVSGRLRKYNYHMLSFIYGKFLLTKAKRENYKDNLVRKKIDEVEVFSLSEMRDLLDLNAEFTLTKEQIEAIGDILVPRSNTSIPLNIKTFEDFFNLELISNKEDKFRCIYSGYRKPGRDKIILTLYDFSASKVKEVYHIAKKEFEVLEKLQNSPWFPNIMDPFQEAKNYPGEIYFFSYLGSEALTMEKYAKVSNWTVKERLYTAKRCFNALKFLHEHSDETILHKNINPKTIRVYSDNEPLFTQLQYAKSTGENTVTETIVPELKEDEEFVAPEVRPHGLDVCTKESDIYSLCATLMKIFEEKENPLVDKISKILSSGLKDEVEKRSSLEEIKTKLDKLYDTVTEKDVSKKLEELDVKYWDENTVRELNGRYYRIINKLGGGGVGLTFKVMEVLDPDNIYKELSGPYVAKVIVNENIGEKAAQAYAKVRAQTGRNNLAGVLEVRSKWEKNEITALLKWIEGDPLDEWKSVLPLYLEELNEEKPEDILLNWLKKLCEGLHELHNNNLVHGDVSPKNIILSGSEVTLTDYDLSTEAGEKPLGGTEPYTSPTVEKRISINPSDDIYALAASFFDVLFDSYPFKYDDKIIKEKGINWAGLNRSAYPRLAEFLDKALHPEPEERYGSAIEALSVIKELIHATDTDIEIRLPELASPDKLTDNEVPWLLNILQSYPASPKGNAETRGLDSEFAELTYVETELDNILIKEILDGKVNLVILCGNAGDGKTAFLQNLAKTLGISVKTSAHRLWETKLDNGFLLRANLDGAASYEDRSSVELLNEFFTPFQDGKWNNNIVYLVAINDGPLSAWIEEGEDSWLKNQLDNAINNYENVNIDYRIRFIDLNSRSLVGGYKDGKTDINTEFLNKLIDKLLGNRLTWEPCNTCASQYRCTAHRSVSSLNDDKLGPIIRKKITRALQAVHQRGEVHITARSLRAALSYILFGYHYCTDLKASSDIKLIHYWDRAFNPKSEHRQGELLSELELLDPALDSHPFIDRYLLKNNAFPVASEDGNSPNLSSYRRKAYFEWPEEKNCEIGGNENALNLSKGKYLSDFLLVGNGSEDDRDRICSNICRGMARIEDLPEKALIDDNWVPLRITPRTPTETLFWINKPRKNFSIKPYLPRITKGLDSLHTQIILTYKFSNGHKEELMIGASLFHILMELKDGYQISDICSDDIFANLSIFKQRLAQEEENVLFALNPMDNDVFKIFSDMDNEIQKLIIQVTGKG